MGQEPFAPFFDTFEKERRPGLPVLKYDNYKPFMMRAFYPEYYKSDRQINRDIRWVNRNDSTFRAVLDSLGDSILALTEDLSGIKWSEPELEITLLKYFRRVGMYRPLVFPLRGIKMEDYSEAVPSGLHSLLNVIKFIAGRNLMQLEKSDHPMNHLSSHPLLQKTSYRFDILTLTLAIACAEQIIPSDSLELILPTEHWKRHNPGWELYKNHFRYGWMLLMEQPLVTYLAAESYNSPLVELTRTPRITTPKTDDNTRQEPIKLTAGGGQLGFSVSKTRSGMLEVADADSLGVAFHCGLRTGDKIKRVNGEYPRNARDLMGKILDKIDSDGVYMIVVRENEEIGILLLPLEEIYQEIFDPMNEY
jgi:hypothetical protein